MIRMHINFLPTMKINSRAKGAAGERELASWLTKKGWWSKRGQQHAGGEDSPDVKSELPFHIECKRVEKLNLADAVDQAMRDCGSKPWSVFHRKNRQPWLVTLDAGVFVDLLKATREEQPQKQLQHPSEHHPHHPQQDSLLNLALRPLALPTLFEDLQSAAGLGHTDSGI